MKCDICGDEMDELVDNPSEKPQEHRKKIHNIGQIIHKRDGTMVKKCLHCFSKELARKEDDDKYGGYKKIGKVA